MSFTKPRFYFFGEDSFEHKHTGNTVCESDLVVPHEAPILDKFYIRTWSFQELPSDFKVESKGCKFFHDQTINDEADAELDMPKTFMHYTFFRPALKKDGFIKITAYGKQAKISWENMGDHLLITDFDYRQAKMYPFKLEEVLEDSEKRVEDETRSQIWEEIKSLQVQSKLSSLMKNLNLTD